MNGVRSLPSFQRSPEARNLAHHLASTQSGGRDLWSAALDATPADRTGAVWDILKEVLDPELPISVVDLGLIYGVAVEGRTAVLELTFTATACPCMDFIKEDITDRLTTEHWLDHVRLNEVWDPPWTTARVSAEGKARLKQLGVGA